MKTACKGFLIGVVFFPFVVLAIGGAGIVADWLRVAPMHCAFVMQVIFGLIGSVIACTKAGSGSD